MLQKKSFPFRNIRALFVLLPGLWTATEVHSQNLVPNYSIETANCPTSYSGFPIGLETMIPNWYSVTCTSPDAFTNCSTNSWTQVPTNLFGNQNARTGTNYLGFGMYGGWYDYLGCQLNCSLIAGNSYHVSFWVSRCDNARYAADEIGLYLSSANTKMTCGFGNTVLSYSPQIKNPSGNYLTDQTNWVEIAGTYVAAGGEQYLTIGYFKPWNVADFIDGGTGYSLPRSTYYVDDVSVTGTGNCGLSLDTKNSDFTFPSSPAKKETLQYQYIAETKTILFQNATEVDKVFIQNMNGVIFPLNKTDKNEYTISTVTNGLYILNIETNKEIIRDKIILME